MADDGGRDVPAVRGGEPDRAAPRRQEEKVRHEVQVKQLVAQVQRECPVVSTVGRSGLWDSLVSDFRFGISLESPNSPFAGL